MNPKVSVAIAFVAGVAAGSLAMWKIADMKYKRLEAQVDEELATMKEYYTGRKKSEEKTEEESESESEDDSEASREYQQIIADAGYNYYRNTKVETAETPFDAPYVIEPDDAGSDDYEIHNLTFYSDGVLVDDEDDDVIKDIDDLIGLDSLNHFGEYAHDVVYVRNEEKKTDYEIMRIATRYNET